jgi:arsenite methyltransferase
MSNEKNVKELVKEKYSEIALQSKTTNSASCCGAGGCSTIDLEIMSENYTSLEGYFADADLGLGCGIPTEFAQIKKGDTVVDLGSGAGNDAFVSRSIVGEDGRVIGIDMTETMIELARKNANKLHLQNVEFRLGDIENIPITSNKADVVVSNCVLNLVPNKLKAFSEMYRILKPGGHFSVSDIVLVGALPTEILKEAEMYAGCVSGAIQKNVYLEVINQNGFANVAIKKEKEITLPDDILATYLTPEQITNFKNSGTGIYSITVFGEKPKDCGCGPDCCN